MAKEKATAANVSVEFVLKDGKNGLFSHASQGVCAMKAVQLHNEDINNGKAARDIKLYKRTVEFTDHESVPVGEESIGAKGAVTEEEIPLAI